MQKHQAANAQTIELNATDTSAAGAAATVTIAADADQYWIIDSVHFGYNDETTAVEGLSIAFGGSTKFALPIQIAAATASQKAFYEVIFPRGLYTGTVNEAVVVSLTAGGGAILAYVNVTYR